MRNTTAAFAALSLLATVSVFAQERPTLAVLELRVKDVDRESMLQFVDSLSGALFRTGRADVVDRSRRDAALEEIEFSASTAADAAAQIEVGRQLAATHIVSGSLGRYDEDYVCSLKLVETATAKVVGSVEEVYSDFEDLISSTGDLAAALVRSSAFARRADRASADRASAERASADRAAAENDPVDSLLAGTVAPSWTFFQFSIWPSVQLFPASAAVLGLRIGLPYSGNAALAGIDVGIVNTVSGRMSGVQLGVFSDCGSVRGIQTGVVGFADRAEILQANAAYNSADVLLGVQVGVVNMGGKCVGAQIGIVNVAGLLKGFQLGLVNIVRYGDGAGFMPFLNFRF
ncbi:MAG TPA: hypothetical protein DIC34_16840 [Treponema sp.]|nr:MAG: hypothetical protein A2001_02670 [Treponema sp. GWC1_61_84]HCM28174.1 hypothetical protein [Treponema sp.]